MPYSFDFNYIKPSFAFILYHTALNIQYFVFVKNFVIIELLWGDDMFLKELTNEEFTKFTDFFQVHSLYQTKEYALIMNHQKFESIFLGMINDNKQIVAATLVLIDHSRNFKYAYAPRGFLLDYTDFDLFASFTQEIKKYLGKRNIIAIKLNPYVLRYTHEPWRHLTRKDPNYDQIFENFKKLGYRHLGYNHFFESFKPRYEAVISLNIPNYQLYKNIRKEFRTKIKGAEKNGLTIHLGSKEDFHYLYLQTQKKYPRDLNYFMDCYNYFQLENKIEFYYVKLNTTHYLKVITQKYHLQEDLCNQLARKLTISHEKSKEKYLSQKIDADQLFETYRKKLVYATKLLKDYPNGIVIASALLILNHKEAYLLIDGYDKKYKNMNAKHFLIWKLCEKYANKGYHSFNLGGITDLDIHPNPYKGLNQFKTNFHTSVKEYMGDMELVTNNTLYFMYRNSAPFRNILKK